MPMDVKRTASRLIKRYHTNDPVKLAEYKNIIVTYGDLGGKLGNYLEYHRCQFIIIDPARAPEPLHRFICAHELGHALCTPKANTRWLKAYTLSLDCKIESIANQFAVELMLPDSIIQQHPNISVYELAEAYGIPHSMIKLKNLSIQNKACRQSPTTGRIPPIGFSNSQENGCNSFTGTHYRT
jgi:Zn-dependent peptidase ImmA (M78 family)